MVVGHCWQSSCVVIVAFVALRRSRQGRAWLDSVILKLPVAGGLLQAAIVERVCRVLASLVTAGVDLPRAMAVTAEASNNAVYTEGLNHIREQMMEGQGLAAPLAETGLFPAAARQMFRVGEETGTLDKQLSDGGRLLPPGTRDQGQALHQPVRAGHHHLHGPDRRLRRRRSGLSHVRHLQPGQRHLSGSHLEVR